MNKKALFGFVALLGVLLLFLAVYQANQYWTTKVALEPTLQQLDELAALPAGTLAELAMTSAEVLEQKQQLLGAADSILQTVLVDFVLGVLLLFVGLLYYPRERSHY